MAMNEQDPLPRLQSQRLDLRWLTQADSEELYAIYSDAEVMRYWSCPPYTQKAQAAKLIGEIHDFHARKELYQWGIAERTEQRIVGTCTLAWIDWKNKRAEVGFILNRAYWRQGYTSEALTRLLNHAFNDLNLRRIEADIDPRNIASIRTVEKLGFQREGFLRERWLVNGEVCDSVLYGLLKTDWRQSKSEP